MSERLGVEHEDEAGGALASRARPSKSADAFRTISEVAEDLNVPQHVLRFWETRFAQLRPLKRAGGRRYYRPEDVELLRRIRELLYQNGYTIKGVQKLLRDAPRGGVGPGPDSERAEIPARPAPASEAGDGVPGGERAPLRAAIEQAIHELESIRDELQAIEAARIAGAP